MTNERAIQIIKNEVKCIIRANRGCGRECGKCNLVMDSQEILTAFEIAIKALSKEKSDS